MKWFSTEPRKVYFGDTDAAGVAHHSQYLKWFEAGRIDMLEGIGCSYVDLQAQKQGFSPVNIDIAYKIPLVFGDEFVIQTQIVELKRASIVMKAQIVSDKGVHTTMTVKLACLDEANWQVTAIPQLLIDSAKRFNDDL